MPPGGINTAGISATGVGLACCGCASTSGEIASNMPLVELFLGDAGNDDEGSSSASITPRGKASTLMARSSSSESSRACNAPTSKRAPSRATSATDSIARQTLLGVIAPSRPTKRAITRSPRAEKRVAVASRSESSRRSRNAGIYCVSGKRTTGDSTMITVARVFIRTNSASPRRNAFKIGPSRPCCVAASVTPRAAKQCETSRAESPACHASNASSSSGLPGSGA